MDVRTTRAKHSDYHAKGETHSWCPVCQAQRAQHPPKVEEVAWRTDLTRAMAFSRMHLRIPGRASTLCGVRIWADSAQVNTSMAVLKPCQRCSDARTRQGVPANGGGL